MHEWGGLTRFADSAIHQSTCREDTGLRVRVVSGGRIGVAASNDFSPEGARARGRERAGDGRGRRARPAVPGPRAEAADVPERRRLRRGHRRRHARGARRRASRALDRAVPRRASPPPAPTRRWRSRSRVANTEGQFCWAPSTQASLTTVMTGGERRQRVRRGVRRRVGRASTPRRSGGAPPTRRSHRSARAPSSPGATRWSSSRRPSSTLVGFLAWVGLRRARATLEGRSCFSGKAGPAGRRAVDHDLRRRAPTRARSASRSTSKACRAGAST